MFLGAAFLMREIELAYARLAHLRLNTAKLRVSLDLPVSKTDPSAVGCTRVWGCTCQAPMVTGDCVYHAAAAHLAIVHAVLGIASGDPLAQALLLFPDSGGDTVSKAAVVGTIEFIAARLDEPLSTPKGCAVLVATRCGSLVHSGLAFWASASSTSRPSGDGPATPWSGTSASRMCPTWHEHGGGLSATKVCWKVMSFQPWQQAGPACARLWKSSALWCAR